MLQRALSLVACLATTAALSASSVARSTTPLTKSALPQLARMTVLSIDTADISQIAEFVASSGDAITDATTNPAFVSKMGQSGKEPYKSMVESSLAYAKGDVALAMDKLAVTLGVEISKLVPGYVSTEVDPRLSFDTAATLARARRIIALYAEEGVPKERVLIKIGATWEGIAAAEVLEKEGIRCNLTLVFGMAQAVACAQRGATLISPFVGRIHEWALPESVDYHAKEEIGPWDPKADTGIVAVKKMQRHYKNNGYDTICMPASWRPTSGEGWKKILVLAGVDRMTIPPALLEGLADNEADVVSYIGTADDVEEDAEWANIGTLSENDFRLKMNEDECTTVKLAEGLRQFIGFTDELEAAMRDAAGGEGHARAR